MASVMIGFLLAAAGALVLTPLAGRVARALGAIDRPTSSRKAHARAVPRLGGLAIVAGFLAALAFVVPVEEAIDALGARSALRDFRLAALVASSLLVAAVGVYDDVAGARPRHKLLVQLAAGAVAWAGGVRLDALPVPFGEPVALGALGLPATVLWLAACSNALNLLDGLDGLAAGVATVAGAGLAALAVGRGDEAMVLAGVALSGASAGFLRWNAHRASIFMGDTGSLFLGFALGACGLSSGGHPGTPPILGAAVVLLVPLGDMALAIARRAVRGAPLFRGDRGHVHHRLLDRGLAPPQAALALHATGAVLVAAAVAVELERPALVLAAVAAGLGVALRRLGYLPVEALPRIARERRRNAALRACGREAAAALQRVRSVHELWTALCAAAGALGAPGLALRVAPGQHQPVLVRAAGLEGAAHRTRHPLRGSGDLELGWAAGAAVDRDLENAVERLCDELDRALRRLGLAARRERPRAAEPLELAGAQELPFP
jgi:UDP-GlcNAc:undecaprenyl-phosphate GlcNAc-1-phosphate transferase